ncbi:hypothetical protein HOF65_03525 [bacterium]|jgi:hypothetical protein|nr:hypothetical protein [bacterium]
MTIIVQKSGCNQTSKITHHNNQIKGRYHSLNDLSSHLYFLKNAAKNIIRANFKNSVGCIVNGSHGILIHHLAHLKLSHIQSTINNSIIATQNICFEYFSKNE